MRKPASSVSRSHRDSLLGLCFAVGLAAAVPSQAVEGLFVAARAARTLPDRPVVVLDAGRTSDIALHDKAAVIHADRLVGVGRVFLTEPNRSAVRLAWAGGAVAPGDRVLVLHEGLPAVCRVALPEGASIMTTLDRLSAGHRTAWLSHGRDAGLILGDSLLVRRSDRTLALTEVIEVTKRQALVRVHTLSADVAVRRGDRAVLWPSPAEQRSGECSMPVSTVTASGEEQRLWLPGGPSQGLTMDRRIEVFRKGEFIATALVDAPGQTLSRATTVEAYTREPVKPGDEAVLLSAPPGPGHVGRIFLIDKDYYLISVGEDMGIRRGQKLLACRDGQVVSRLVVQTVKQSYCGARRDTSEAAGAGRAKAWDEIRLTAPRPRTRSTVGLVERAILSGRFITGTLARPTDLARPGTLVRIGREGERPCAALVLHKSSSAIVLYVPSCWAGRDRRPGDPIVCTRAETNSD